MKRLTYSPSAYLRRMQISRAPLFVFIEGYRDRYVYDQIVQPECQESGIQFKVVTAEEIGISGGGKDALLGFFDYLAARSSLICDFKGRITAGIFFLDKDVDDILGVMRKSDHIVYTQTYEIENCFFIHGVLGRVAAASASVELRLIDSVIGDSTAWRGCAATNWKRWVTLCLVAKSCNIKSMRSYGLSRSPINDGVRGPLKIIEYRRRLSDLKTRSALPVDDFKRLFRRLSRRVDRIYSRGQHDLIFPGKWYACFLVEDIKRVAGRRRVNRNQLETRLLSDLPLTLDCSHPWTEHFRGPLRNLIAKLET